MFEPYSGLRTRRPVLVFISGAARSGKSEWAETYALSLADGKKLVYIATARADDPEMRRRVALHQASRRDKGFETLERYTGVGGVVSQISLDSTVLLECLGTLLANEMFSDSPLFNVRKIFDDVLSLRARAANLLVVSNDIFSDGISYDELTEKYRQALGALHVMLAGAADLAVECVAGQSVFHRSGR